jgi:hypothetical protein
LNIKLRLLTSTLTDELIKPQFIPSLLSRIFGNPIGRKLAWDYVKDNWDYLYRRHLYIFNCNIIL